MGCLNDMMKLPPSKSDIAAPRVSVLWNHPHPLSPTPIWAGDLTEDMQRLGVSAQFCLSMTGEIRVCRWRVRGGKIVQQFHLHTMGRALPVSHVYLGVLLNCDAK